MYNSRIDLSRLVIERTTTPKPKPVDKSKLLFGRQFTDHMLLIPWEAASGWGTPRITAYAPLALDLSCSCFHYGLEVFEGMKAYKDAQGRVRLFRPMMNINRLNISARRIALPECDAEGFFSCLKELLRLESDWIPEGKGFSLYVRPCLIATQATLGVAVPQSALLFVILSPVGPYYPTGWKAVKLLCSDGKYCRAWPGGTGFTKCGGNYAPTILPAREAQEKGYQQVLWLYEDRITEVGTMNFFVFIINDDGERELITCPLGDTILPGVTRDSVLGMARAWNEFKVSERYITMRDLARLAEAGKVIEAFGTGTAAVVSPVCMINYEGRDYKIPLNPSDAASQAGPLTQRIYEELTRIQYGEVTHEWSVLL
ncbi:branched-chain amino acid aminotransferase [Pelomyxa schiedti]|nr:branched-chain amino acid aminotransferase [Pelomyxa schiedti]